MRAVQHTHIKLIAVLSLAVFLVACESGPKAPQPGTPAFNWLAAKGAYKGGDYAKTTDLLIQIARTENEYAERARAWALVLSAGASNAYMELADKFDEGAKQNRSNPTPFRKYASGYKTKGSAAGMQFAELAHRFIDVNKDKEVVLAFDVPPATMDDPPQLQKITSGQLIPDAEIEGVEQAMVERAILKTIGRFLNTGTDVEKTKAAFQGGEAKTPGPLAQLAVAKCIWDVSEMFGAKKLDQPQRIRMLYEEATQALAFVKDNKDAKVLAKKIADSKKKLRLD